MAATTKRLLHLRPSVMPTLRPQHYSVQHHFSSSPDPPPNGPQPQIDLENRSSFSSHFQDIKATLQKDIPQHSRTNRPPNRFSFSNRTPTPRPSEKASLDEIRKNLSDFRSRTAPPLPSSLDVTNKHVSFEELYKKTTDSKVDGSYSSGEKLLSSVTGGRLDFDSIRENVRQLRSTDSSHTNQNDSEVTTRNQMMSLGRLKESLRLRPGNTNVSPLIIGASDKFPVFKVGKDSAAAAAAMRSEFGKAYNYQDLGKRLESLRPQKMKGKWFSLQELSDRLAKLRELEDKENEDRTDGLMKQVRESIVSIISSNKEENQKGAHRVDILSQLGGTPSYMLSPPKDHLVKKYLHPDHLSSGEKLKLELKKVRDEFKMSESDCGSARVQVAQLTTKIKHLSNVLLKKDKHSRKGLQEMVQRRKKLLKYLRRTDWDSYTLVLSKFGLRDNPDSKFRC